MSHQSQSPSQQPPQAFSPQQAYPSSTAPPPAKRQRLSPDARSPGPSYANGTYGGQSSYGNPYAPAHMSPQQPYSGYAPSPVQQYSQNSFNTPQPYQSNRPAWQPGPQRANSAMSPPGRDMMPPPPRPAKEDNVEKFGVEDVNDALFSSGINLKDEENYIHNTFANKHSAESFPSNQTASFGSSGASQGGSFNLLTQATSFSSQSNALGSGTLGLAVSQDSVDDEVKHMRLQAARRKADADQHHLRNPFLKGDHLRLLIERISRENGVRLDVNGLYVLMPQTKTLVSGDSKEGIVEAKAMAGSMIDSGVPFADILSLTSLAAAERVRGLLDESHALAKARKYADYGRVPVEFSDIATGHDRPTAETVTPEHVTDTPWDQPAEGTEDQPQTTIAFQSKINSQLRSLAKRAEDAEQARLKRRAARRKAAENAANDEDTTANGADSVDAPAGGDSGTGPPQVKMTKKEIARQQKEKASLSEAQAASTTNKTAALMTGGRSYSWMNGGGKSMPTNRFAKPSAPGTPSGSGTPNKKEGTRTPMSKKAEVNGIKQGGMQWGEWRENASAGKQIQARDWLLVLERDGREKKALERAQLMLGRPHIPKATTEALDQVPATAQSFQANAPAR